MKTFWLKIKKWYQGEYIPYKDIPNTIVLAGYYKRTTSANVIHGIVDYFKKHKTWLIPLLGIIVGIGIFTIALLSYIRK